MDKIFCPVCGGDVTFLGSLSKLGWYRCICCGMNFHADLIEDKVEEEAEDDDINT